MMTASRGRGTRAAASNTGREIAKVTVDSFDDSRNAGFIKFDVEGSELAAIEGAAGTILKCRPAMKIACYHRSEDVFALVRKILEICPEYKVYMRHTRCIPGWDTDFYFIQGNP
jgi:hypothetical protein